MDRADEIMTTHGSVTPIRPGVQPQVPVPTYRIHAHDRPATRFTARWPGECTECGSEFDAGDEAGYIPGIDGVHCWVCLDDHDSSVGY